MAEPPMNAGDPFPIDRAADGLRDDRLAFSTYPTPKQTLAILRRDPLWVVAGVALGILTAVWVWDLARATWYWIKRDRAVVALRRRLHRKR
jgi:hypothetical protein